MVLDETRTAEVDHFDFTLTDAFDENIFRFQITMYHMQTMYFIKCDQHLERTSLNPAQGELQFVFTPELQFTVDALQLLQVVLEQFCHDDQMFLVLELILEFEHVVFIRVTVGVEVSEQFDFVHTLVEVVFVVVYHFEADQGFVDYVFAHLGFGEGS